MITSTRAVAPPAGTRLISIDYGKTAGRWWQLPARRRRWLSVIGEVKSLAPGALVRAFNVSRDTATYRRLWNAGVDLIGVKPK